MPASGRRRFHGWRSFAEPCVINADSSFGHHGGGRTCSQAARNLRSLCAVSCLALVGWCPSLSEAAQKYELRESSSDTRTYRVTHSLSVVGQLQAAKGDGSAVGLPLSVDATARYCERRLPGIGRDAESLRCVRSYDQAEARIEVNRRPTTSKLHDQHRLIVVQGRSEGPEPYCPDGPLTRNELDLLHVPADSLALQGLLPRAEVAIGDTWNPGSWAVQMLLGIEAVLNGELTCRLESADSQAALVKMTGIMDGATGGAATKIDVSGHYLCDLRGRFIKSVELRQKEKRSVGTVSPGMTVTAEATWTRTPTNDVGALSESALANIPQEPPEHLLRLWFDCPWKLGFTYERDWHIFHRTHEAAVLRLLDKGSLVAQCNVSPVPITQPGKQTSGEQFRIDVQRELGDKLKSIEKSEQIPIDSGGSVYRITAVGKSNDISMYWLYYLCTAPSGRQVAFMFAVDTDSLERFADRDLQIVRQLRWLP